MRWSWSSSARVGRRIIRIRAKLAHLRPCAERANVLDNEVLVASGQALALTADDSLVSGHLHIPRTDLMAKIGRKQWLSDPSIEASTLR